MATESGMLAGQVPSLSTALAATTPEGVVSWGPADTTSLLLALAMLLCCAHGVGYVFRRLRQPPVIGEIVGGLLLGPTVLGALLPDVYETLFAASSPTRTVLGAIYQLGLLLLMFCSGTEIRPSFERGERRTVLFITAGGTLLPFALGIAALPLIDVPSHLGPAGNRSAFAIVFAVAIAVTSIPVISRILYDLRILDTSFARVVLSSAVIEDVVLYVLLAVALSMVDQAHGEAFGLPPLLGLEPGSAAALAYYVGVTGLFLGLSLAFGASVYRWVERLRYNVLSRSSAVAHMLTFVLAMSSAALFLGIAPMFGAFVAGLAARRATGEKERPVEAIKGFSFAFFIPVYFAVVGLQLDLGRGFDPLFFVGFLAFCCLTKAASVYAGAALAGERPRGALNFAVALNARGGPGIVLASLAYDARIIDQGFYAALIGLVIVTSLLAGSWLQRVVRRGEALR